MFVSILPRRKSWSLASRSFLQVFSQVGGTFFRSMAFWTDLALFSNPRQTLLELRNCSCAMRSKGWILLSTPWMNSDVLWSRSKVLKLRHNWSHAATAFRQHGKSNSLGWERLPVCREREDAGKLLYVYTVVVRWVKMDVVRTRPARVPKATQLTERIWLFYYHVTKWFEIIAKICNIIVLSGSTGSRDHAPIHFQSFSGTLEWLVREFMYVRMTNGTRLMPLYTKLPPVLW